MTATSLPSFPPDCLHGFTVELLNWNSISNSADPGVPWAVLVPRVSYSSASCLEAAPYPLVGEQSSKREGHGGALLYHWHTSLARFPSFLVKIFVKSNCMKTDEVLVPAMHSP